MNNTPPLLCHYFQARVDRKRAWFVMGVFRNEGNVAFVRALETNNDFFEFFVPQGLLDEFFLLMKYLENHCYVSDFVQKPNRLA